MKVSVSLLSADFSRLAEQVKEVETAGADALHLDMMDGCFVPNLSFGPMVAEALRPYTLLPFHAHLMVACPDQYLKALAETCQQIAVHAEAGPHLHRTLSAIRDLGLRTCLVLNPATPLEWMDYLLPLLDSVLLMTVNPGFGGQSFLYEVLPKIRSATEKLRKADHPIELEVDGGVNVETGRLCKDAGATLLVAGTAVFQHPGGIQEGIRLLKEL